MERIILKRLKMYLLTDSISILNQKVDESLTIQIHKLSYLALINRGPKIIELPIIRLQEIRFVYTPRIILNSIAEDKLVPQLHLTVLYTYAPQLNLIDQSKEALFKAYDRLQKPTEDNEL